MWSIARLALMWLLAVALPMQGASAAAMQACGMGFHRTVDAGPIAHVHDENVMAAGPAGHSYGHQAHEAAHAHAATGSPHPDKARSNPASAHKCNVCALCCLGAVVSSRPVLLQSPKLKDFYRPFVNGILAVFLTQGIERPPRIVFA